MVQIKWIRSAKFDLREIYEYIASDSKRYAKFQVERIESRTEVLKSQIRLGKEVTDFKDPSIR